MATALAEAIARHLGAQLAVFSLDGLVCWPSGELSSGTLSTVRQAATAVARARRPVVLDGHAPPAVVAAPLPTRDGSLGSLVVVTPDSDGGGTVPRVEALARQAAAALENALQFERGEQQRFRRESSEGVPRQETDGRPRRPAGAPQEQVNVVVVDDHTIVREGLRSLLEEAGARVVGEAGSAADALEVIGRSQPDVVLLELTLSRTGPREGLELCRHISERFPAVRVVVLTAFQDQALVLDALRRGARGYVAKDIDAAGLVNVIRAVQRGESGLDSHSASAVVRSVVAGTDAHRELSPRELEVLRLVAGGRTNREIGEECFISESTVKFHVRHVMTKLGVRHRAEVVYAAGRLGLI
ncbi:MAG TPA: response regulator transcription factor [Candidatus Dormibacteraeota bacterium]|nr:response regulator transcription factor [Candidatus Dormibacteraeota bacterium]